MFVTIVVEIDVLPDDIAVVKEYICSGKLCQLSTDHYLSCRRDSQLRNWYTPTRVIVRKKGSHLFHVVEFTGCHYAALILEPDMGWLETGMLFDTAIPCPAGTSSVVYEYTPSIARPDVRPLTEKESLLHDYVLTLANDYFNDRFHLNEE